MSQTTTETGGLEGLGGQVFDSVQAAVSTAQEKGAELRAQGSAQLREQFDRRSTETGTQIRSLADALRRSGSEMGEEGGVGMTKLVVPAADRIERVGSYLEQRSGEELFDDVESFARRRPWALAGIGVIAGLTAARVMKASSERRYDRSRGFPHTYAGESHAPVSYGAAPPPVAPSPITSEEIR